jgi:hypothetical protein
MSNPFRYLQGYKELVPYLEAVRKVKDGIYVTDLEDIKNNCIKEHHKDLAWGEKGLESFPDAQVFFEAASEQNKDNQEGKSNSERSIQRKKSLEKAFE